MKKEVKVYRWLDRIDYKFTNRLITIKKISDTNFYIRTKRFVKIKEGESRKSTVGLSASSTLISRPYSKYGVLITEFIISGAMLECFHHLIDSKELYKLKVNLKKSKK